MTNSEIKQIWFTIYSTRPNFITPIIIEYIEKGHHIIEISKSNNYSFSIYGVSVITKVNDGSDDNYQPNRKLSNVFSSYVDAINYIDTLDEDEYFETDEFNIDFNTINDES